MAKSQQVPSSHKYHPVLQPKQKLSNNSIYHKPYNKPSAPTKEQVGPGVYATDEALKTFCFKRSSTAALSKSKRDCFAQTKAKESSFVPGAGAYNATFNTISFKAEKNRVPDEKQKIIKRNSKVIRLTDKVMKDKTWVPGPGTYYASKNKKADAED